MVFVSFFSKLSQTSLFRGSIFVPQEILWISLAASLISSSSCEGLLSVILMSQPSSKQDLLSSAFSVRVSFISVTSDTPVEFTSSYTFQCTKHNLGLP